jgi:hypothetical protein
MMTGVVIHQRNKQPGDIHKPKKEKKKNIGSVGE